MNAILSMFPRWLIIAAGVVIVTIIAWGAYHEAMLIAGNRRSASPSSNRTCFGLFARFKRMPVCRYEIAWRNWIPARKRTPERTARTKYPAMSIVGS